MRSDGGEGLGSVILGREAAALAAWSTRSWSRNPTWPGIHTKVTVMLFEFSVESVMKIRWVMGLEEYGLVIECKDERESVRMRYLLLEEGGSCEIWVRHE